MADFLANDTYYYTPVSSPPSSPVYWDNLSPIASESEDEGNTRNPWKLISDPYSGNAKATQSPLIHDDDHNARRASRPWAIPLTPSSSFASYASVSPSPIAQAKAAIKRLMTTAAHEQDTLWEDAMIDVFRNGASIIDLDNSNTSFIPRTIIDLNHIISLPTESEVHPLPSILTETPTRSAIASAAARSRRVLSQTRSNNKLFSGSPVCKENGKRERELQIYLANNNLTVLPTELFALRGLTLLTLRANKLRELPSAISQLKSLRSLNISNNDLTYLPSEIASLELQTLLVNPNPFLPPPLRVHSNARLLGPLQTRPHVPKLYELALRVALSKPPKLPSLMLTPTTTRAPLPTPSPSHTSVFKNSSLTPSNQFPPHALLIASHYDLPSWLPSLPEATARRIRAVLHGSEDARDVYGMCFGPQHQPEDGCARVEASDNSGLFVEPTEQRFEWVTSLAGCQLTGAVPLLWRGCKAGCLSFLDAGETDSGGTNWVTRRVAEKDEDDEFIQMFGVEASLGESTDNAIVGQIVWDDIMDLDD